MERLVARTDQGHGLRCFVERSIKHENHLVAVGDVVADD